MANRVIGRHWVAAALALGAAMGWSSATALAAQPSAAAAKKAPAAQAKAGAAEAKAGAGEAEKGAGVKLKQEENRIAVTVGGEAFTDYYYGPEGGRMYTRPFMYPVRAADGTVVTNDQSQAKGGDHPHHRSLWVAFGDVNGVDHWALKGGHPPRQKHIRFDKVEGDALVEELAWEDEQGKAMLNETRTVRFFQFPDGNRGIDITSEYKSANGPVTFGDTKEAGLCAVRVAKEIAADPVLTLSTGAVSRQNADKAKKQPGDEANVWGKEADWCDISGKIGAKTYGVSILDHPSNPRPARWHARRYGLVGANNVGASDFDKKDPKSYIPFIIEPGKPVTFRYRVVIHQGGADEAKVAEKYADFK